MKTNLIKKAILWSTVALAAVVLLDPSMAHAQNALTTSANNANATAKAVVPFLSVAVGGIGVALMGAGVMSLKKHGDNAQQNPLTPALVKLAAGALAMGVAVSAGNIQSTLFGSQTAATVKELKVN